MGGVGGGGSGGGSGGGGKAPGKFDLRILRAKIAVVSRGRVKEDPFYSSEGPQLGGRKGLKGPTDWGKNEGTRERGTREDRMGDYCIRRRR